MLLSMDRLMSSQKPRRSTLSIRLQASADIGAEEYDIFAIKDKFTLYFGDKTDPTNGTTADLRPTQLTDAVKYTR
jgi:hypothetical protein